MGLANTTYLTDTNKWGFGPFIELGKQALYDRPNALAQNQYFTLSRIKGECLNIEEFAIGSKFGEGLAAASLRDGESLVIPLEGKLNIKRHKIKFGREYTCPLGHFNLLIPQGEDRIYVAYELPQDKQFVQWANHSHSKEAHKIIEDGEYALFQNVDYGILPLAAIISGSDILMLGQSLVVSTGYYKEIGRVDISDLLKGN